MFKNPICTTFSLLLVNGMIEGLKFVKYIYENVNFHLVFFQKFFLTFKLCYDVAFSRRKVSAVS